jgi:hypothetical protein
MEKWLQKSRNETSLGYLDSLKHGPITILDIIFGPVFFLKTQHFEHWILFSSSGGTYSDRPNRKSKSLFPDHFAQLSRFHLKTETEYSLRNIEF